MSFIKKWWKAIAGVVGAVIGYIVLKQHFTKDLLAKLRLASVEKDSAVIDAQVAEKNKQAAELSSEAAKAREAANKPADTSGPTDVEKFWNK